MPGKICNGCGLKIGFFKKKQSCQICLGYFCSPCVEAVRTKSELQEKLLRLSGFHCLTCLVLNCRGIKREHLFLLQSKQLNEYLSNKNISTVSCKEKYDLIDLIMEYAKTNNRLSAEDREHQNMHDNHLRNLQRAAEDMKKEDNAHQNNQTDDGEEGTSHRNSDTFSSGSSASFSHSSSSATHTSSSSQHFSPEHSQHTQQQHSQQQHSQQQQSHDTETSGFRFFNIDMSNVNTQHHQQQQQHQDQQPQPQPQPQQQQQQQQYQPPQQQQQQEQQYPHSYPQQPPQQPQQQQPPPTSPDTSTGSNNTTQKQQQKKTKWKSMEDVSSVEEITTLSVTELKQILTANFINYKGCVEKKELIDKVTMLFKSVEENKKRQERAEQQRNQTAASGSDGAAEAARNYERDICKICMDNTIDCVLLNCGHLVTCAKCGKRLNECPICRSLVVRVNHIFRA